MSRNLHLDAPLPRVSPIRDFGPCDRVLGLLVLWTLVHATEACAGDQPPVWGGAQNPDFRDLREPTALSSWSFPVPITFRPLDLRATVAPVPASQEFRARPATPPPADLGNAFDSEPLIRETTIWQRLAEFRARSRVPLVTLWQTGGNSLSLQAGRKGDPTLQWTSRLSAHGAGGSGLLDELFSTSVGGVGGAVGRSLHFAPRSSTAEPSIKPGKSMDAGLAGVGGTTR